MINLTELFCSIHDFWKNFEKLWNEKLLAEGKAKARKRSSLCPSGVMAIIILFHVQGYRNFKTFYNHYVVKYLRQEFPSLTSYNRFVELKSQVVFPLHCYLMTRLGPCIGLSFIDSASLEVCHPKRVHSHKVFDGIAKWGKTSVGYFHGFKLHIVVNDKGELLAYMITADNVDDRKPVPKLSEKVFGKLFGDKGYISSELFESLRAKGIQLITKLKSNMKNKLMPLMDKLLLRKRGIIKTIIDQLKNISQIEHTRHRSPMNFLVNLLSGLIAYTLRSKKTPLHLRKKEFNLLNLN